jgi:hypothetical protein
MASLTHEQLAALMEGVKAQAQDEVELRDENPDPQGAYRQDAEKRARLLCAAFGFEMEWDGKPKQP